LNPPAAPPPASSRARSPPSFVFFRFITEPDGALTDAVDLDDSLRGRPRRFFTVPFPRAPSGAAFSAACSIRSTRARRLASVSHHRLHPDHARALSHEHTRTSTNQNNDPSPGSLALGRPRFLLDAFPGVRRAASRASSPSRPVVTPRPLAPAVDLDLLPSDVSVVSASITSVVVVASSPSRASSREIAANGTIASTRPETLAGDIDSIVARDGDDVERRRRREDVDRDRSRRSRARERERDREMGTTRRRVKKVKSNL